MKIAIYYPWIHLTSGVERTILEIVKRSDHEYTIFTNHYDKRGTHPEFNNLKIIQLVKVPVERDLLSVLKAAIIITFQKIDLNTFDLLLVHSDGLADLITFRNYKIPIVCYCHTPLRPVFDKLYRKEVLKKCNTISKTLFYFLSLAFKYLDRRLWRKYSYVLFNSRETLRRARNGGLLRELKNKYCILNPGVDLKKTKPGKNFRKYFLVPGRIMWTKNIQLAIEGFVLFKRNIKYKDFRLVIAGQVDQKSKSYLSHLKDAVNKRSDIKFIDSPEEKLLNKLYAGCWATLHTAFNEDFGLTLLESNAYGKPVIAVNSGGYMDSQINKKTGLLVPSYPRYVADSLALLADKKELTMSMGAFARKNVRKYDWQNFINVYKKKLLQFEIV